MSGPWQRVVGVLLLWVALVEPAGAVENGTLTMARLESEGWVAENIEVHLRFSEEAALVVEGNVGRIAVRGGDGLTDAGSISFSCTGLVLYTDSLFACPDGTMLWSYGPFSVPVAIAVARNADAQLTFSFGTPGEGRGEGHGLEGQGDWSPAGWRLVVEAPDLDPSALVDPDAISASGRLALTIEISADADGVRQVDLDVASAGLDFSDATGSNAGEGLVFQLLANAKRTNGDWDASASGNLEAGQAYVDPVYLDLTQRPASLSAKADWAAESRRAAGHIEVHEVDTVRLAADAGWMDGQLGELVVDLNDGQLPGLYASWLQPFLIGTLLDDLETAGRVRGRLEHNGGGSGFELHLADIHLDDRKGRIGAYGVNGDLYWDSQSSAISRLHVDGGHLYRLNIGAVDLPLESDANGARLMEPVDIPLLDGALNVQELSVGNWGTDGTRLQLQAGLSPISLESFTHALGLPVLGGELSGHVPRIVYANGDLTLEGALELEALGGRVVVENLVVDDMLGLVPRLRADVVLQNLDLELLTRAYSFGRVTGRLEGAIHELELIAWEPVRFDARLGTPPEDDLPHRISQRAVDNLTALGGGISGTLSGTFLQFFEEFRYDRLGLSCRLENGVCVMDGIAPASEGYYIVRGSGLPRIDVIGFNRRVAWADLVRRLKRITREGAAVVD